MKFSAGKTFLCLALSVSWLGSVVAADAAPAKGKPAAQLTISVFSGVPLSRDALREMEDQAARVFQVSEIQVLWLDCSGTPTPLPLAATCNQARFPDHLHVRIVRQALRATPETVGVSFLSEDGNGCYADVFYEPVALLESQQHMPMAALLGHALAHEVGHLLLGTRSHSGFGIMRARWSRDELSHLTQGTLVFSQAEARRMRERLAASERSTSSGLISLDLPR